MQLFCVICWHKPNLIQSHQNQHKLNEAHRAYAEKSGIVRFSGPFLSEDGEDMIGNFILLETANRTDAENWADNDPYQKAACFERVEIHPWQQAFGGLPKK